MDDAHELRRIRGIGAARADWLQATFGIRGLADLAALEPDEISRRLAESGRGGVARDAVASWVATARELASAGTDESAAPAREETGVEREGEAWRPRASFVVEFQSMNGGGAGSAWRTAAHHVERDGDEAWPGIDFDGLVRWMTGLWRLSGRSSRSEASWPPSPPPTPVPPPRRPSWRRTSQASS